MIKKTLTDKDILHAIKLGSDDKALSTLYTRLLPKVKRLAKQFKLKDIDAYDVFQESILKFYDYVKLDKFNEKYAIDAFVVTVARNKIIDIIRKNNSRVEVEIVDSTYLGKDIEYDTYSVNEKRNTLEALFSSIGEKCKELLLLSIYDKRSMKEISTMLGFSSQDSAKTQSYKCKQKLINSLKENPTLAKEVMSYV